MNCIVTGIVSKLAKKTAPHVQDMVATFPSPREASQRLDENQTDGFSRRTTGDSLYGTG